MPSRNTRYPFRESTYTLREIAAMTGIYHKTLLYRYKTGKSMDEAAAAPVLTMQECGRRAAALYRSRTCSV